MKAKRNSKSSATRNSNETLVKDPKAAGLRIKTHVRAGKIKFNE